MRHAHRERWHVAWIASLSSAFARRRLSRATPRLRSRDAGLIHESESTPFRSWKNSCRDRFADGLRRYPERGTTRGALDERSSTKSVVSPLGFSIGGEGALCGPRYKCDGSRESGCRDVRVVPSTMADTSPWLMHRDRPAPIDNTDLSWHGGKAGQHWLTPGPFATSPFSVRLYVSFAHFIRPRPRQLLDQREGGIAAGCGNSASEQFGTCVTNRSHS